MKRITLLSILATTACGAPPDDELSSYEVTGTQTAALQLGDTGPRVAWLTQYFEERGYYENEQLKERFPNWRPVLGAPPEAPDSFGESLEHAVKQYQTRFGLEVTGVVDPQLQRRLELPHCGVPVSAELPGVDKWAKHALGWRTAGSYTYSINNMPNQLGRLSNQEAEGEIELAFADWAYETGVDFDRQDGSSADIQVSIMTSTTPIKSDGRGKDFGITDPFTGDIWLDPAEDWDDNRRTDLSVVMLHEIGHTMGFEHSSIETDGVHPNMWATLDQGEYRGISGDDLDGLAVSPYTQWNALPGKQATDLGSGSSGHGQLWITSTESHQFGFQIYHWNPYQASWDTVSGGAVRLDLAGKVPWVVTSNGEVYYRAGVTSGQITGTGWAGRGNPGATEIGVNTNGVVWVINGTRANNHGNQILRHTGGGNWTTIGGGAKRIAVAPNGAPIVVTTQGHLYLRSGVSSSNAGGSGWQRLASHIANIQDVAVDPSPRGRIWITTGGSSPKVYQWNLQYSAAGAPAADIWREPAGTKKLGRDITMAGFSRPAIVDTSGNVFWRQPPPLD